jgi:hypothetical protein
VVERHLGDVVPLGGGTPESQGGIHVGKGSLQIGAVPGTGAVSLNQYA